MAKDYSPIRHTCPMIDEVINIIMYPEWDLSDPDEEKLRDEFKEAIDIMEQIRTANSTLREWGNETYIEKLDLEKEIDWLEKRVAELEYEVRNYQDEIKSLENQLEELENSQS